MTTEYTTLNVTDNLNDFNKQLAQLAADGWRVISSNAYAALNQLNFYALLERENKEKNDVEIGWASGTG